MKHTVILIDKCSFCNLHDKLHALICNLSTALYVCMHTRNVCCTTACMYTHTHIYLFMYD